jgi:alpha-L-rhamnosidase
MNLCRIYFLATVAIVVVSLRAASAALQPAELICEYRHNPTGIDTPQPGLSWISESTQRAQAQTAYQVLVASSEFLLKDNRADLWDSGKVQSNQSVLVPYGGRALGPAVECFWKVRVWDQDGEVSPWSAVAHWSMGLLKEEDWESAKWIGHDVPEQTNSLAGTDWIWFPEGQPQSTAEPATNYFRRMIVIPPGRGIKRARFLYTGDNECRGWINGRDLGARNNYRTVKDTDITYRLQPGTNVLGLTGRNSGQKTKPAGVIAWVKIEFEEGEPILLATDEQWKVAKEEMAGWNEAGFDDSKWISARKLGPAGMEPWGNVRVAESRRQPARWLRKEFALEKPVRRAAAFYSGLGLSELYVNGRKAGDRVLSPALSDYNKRVYYVSLDVTEQVHRGQNALGVVLGNGRFYADRSKVYSGTASFGSPKLLLKLRVEYTDGSVSTILSDESWKWTSDGPILANSEYDGEEYDARKEFPGWSAAGFNDSQWQPAEIVSAPAGKLMAEPIEPIRVTETLTPLKLTEPKAGVFIYDMGQNMVGWCRLKVSGPAGTKVSLRHAETLNPDGTLYMANLRGARVTDTYILKGKGTESWEPRFTYHGFRYIEVKGYPGRPKLDSLEGRVVHDDLANPLLNQVYRNVIWGVRGNYRSIPTDCPQRDERQGWLGDRSEESRGETYIYNNAPLYAKWLQDIADAQRESGSLPDVAPPFWPIYSDNVTWPSTAVLIPETLRRQFGDALAIEREYNTGRRWIEHMLGFVTNGIIAKDSYGDWCMPPEDPTMIHSKDPNRQTSKALLATSYFYHDLRLMEHYATLLCKPDDARRFGELAEQMKSAFNQKFLSREKGEYDNGTQTSCVLPLAFGLVPEDQEQRVFEQLARKITDESKGHIGTGLIGGQYLNRVLSDHGRADLAYTIATQKDYPSWGYMIANGATTIWELWNGNTADPTMNSGNHVMLVGDLVIWLYEYIGGIRPEESQPGFKHVILKPCPIKDLKFARTTHRSPYGLITSHWRQANDRFDWDVNIPANSTATIFVPARNRATVTESGKRADQAVGLRFLRAEKDYVVFEAGSGKYRFRSSKN